MIGWTTVATEAQARSLAAALVNSRLAACVHIEAPLTAVFHWKGEVCMEKEYRLTVKFPRCHCDALARCLLAEHPYETPQWLAVAADTVAEAYHHWVMTETARDEG